MKKAALYLAILAGCNVVLWLIYMPYGERRLAEELSAYSAARGRTAGQGLLSFQDIYTVREKIGEREKKFRERKDFPKLITYLFEQSMGTRVDVKSVNYSFEDKKETPLTRLVLSMSIEGRYEDVRRFMNAMEGGSHYFEIGSVKISRQGHLVTCSLVLLSYLKADRS